MSKKLYLDSVNAVNNVFTLDKKISGRWKLLSFTCTNNMFNVTDVNNKIYLNENGTDRVITLDNGYYDINSLQTEMSSKLNSSMTGTVTVTIDADMNKYTIANTINYYFTFGSNTTNSARKLMGFNESDGSNNTSHTSDKPIDLNNNKNIFINISENDDREIEGINYFNTSLIICGKGSFGEILRYVNDDNFDQYIKVRNTKTLTVSIHDLNNNSIDLNSDYSIVFQKE